MSAPEAIYTFLLELGREGRESFRETHASSFLVVYQPKRTEDDWGGFNTATIGGDSVKLGKELTNHEMNALGRAEGVDAIALEKAPDSPWRDRISVGRAGNCDVVLSSGSISKLHAHFSPGDGDSVTVTDSKSRNGTRLNDETLDVNKPYAVVAGDEILFGSIKTVFHSADSFCDLLEELWRKQ